MKLNYKDMIKALADIEDERRVSEEVVISALKEAMCKAYKKDIDISDINKLEKCNLKYLLLILIFVLTSVPKEVCIKKSYKTNNDKKKLILFTKVKREEQKKNEK